jgi:hypothetical protein
VFTTDSIASRQPNRAQADSCGHGSLCRANVAKLQTWLGAVAAKDPAKAADLFVRVLDDHVPKLARTECTTEVQEQAQTLRIVL